MNALFKPLVEKLIATREMIADPNKWWNGLDRGNLEGRRCLVMALSANAVSCDPESEEYEFVRSHILPEKDRGDYALLSSWNDSHSHQEVITGLDRAIAEAQKQS